MDRADVNETPGATRGYTTLVCVSVWFQWSRGAPDHAHSPDVNSRGGSHTTPLHAASVKGHSQVASILLKGGADPNSCDNLRRVPLHRVSQGGQLVAQSPLEIARLLVISGAEVNAIDSGSWTPLHAAAQSGYRDIAQLLIESGAILDARTRNQETPLLLACMNGKLDVSRLLINRGSSINFPTASGNVPLHFASRLGDVEAAELLLDCGTDVDVHRNTTLDSSTLCVIIWTHQPRTTSDRPRR